MAIPRGDTVSLSARFLDSLWWIGQNGKLVASDADALVALKAAVASSPPADVVVVHWESPPDAVPVTWHSGELVVPTVRDVLAAA